MNEVPNENDIGTQKHTLSRKLTDPIDFKEPIFKIYRIQNVHIR